MAARRAATEATTNELLARERLEAARVEIARLRASATRETETNEFGEEADSPPALPETAAAGSSPPLSPVRRDAQQTQTSPPTPLADVGVGVGPSLPGSRQSTPPATPGPRLRRSRTSAWAWGRPSRDRAIPHRRKRPRPRRSRTSAWAWGRPSRDRAIPHRRRRRAGARRRPRPRGGGVPASSRWRRPTWGSRFRRTSRRAAPESTPARDRDPGRSPPPGDEGVFPAARRARRARARRASGGGADGDGGGGVARARRGGCRRRRRGGRLRRRGHGHGVRGRDALAAAFAARRRRDAAGLGAFGAFGGVVAGIAELRAIRLAAPHARFSVGGDHAAPARAPERRHASRLFVAQSLGLEREGPSRGGGGRRVAARGARAARRWSVKTRRWPSVCARRTPR